MKTSKHTGQRTVKVIDPHTVLVNDSDGGSLYDIDRNGLRFTVTKINAEGEPIPGSGPYSLTVSPPRCSCAGHRLGGYNCRHLGFVNALLARGRKVG